MKSSTKRLRQTTLFESFNGCKRGKILDLMEVNVNKKQELRDILCAAAEKRALAQDVNKKETEIAPDSAYGESCSTTKTIDSTLDNFPISLSQSSDDLFPDMHSKPTRASVNCDNVKATSSANCDGVKATSSINCDNVKATSSLVQKFQIPEVQLNRLPECCPSLPLLKSSNTHTVMFKLPIQNGVCPEPSPCNYHDLWDSDHVRMPCSPESKCPVLQNGEKCIESRWELIEKSLLQDITSSYDLQEAILQYNSQYASRWDFKGLHAFFRNCLSPKETEQFFQCTLPAMIRLTLQLPQMCTQPIPLLKRESNHAITFTQKQIACLLSNAFFCTYPRRNCVRKRNEPRVGIEYGNYPDINFNRLYSGTSGKGVLSRKAEKLKCLLNYFARVTTKEPVGTVTFRRQGLQHFPVWSSSKECFRNAVINSDGVIEVEGFGMLQVDFANKFVGGGVLGGGSVQEEIRFVTCPELIISRLFTECLGIADVLLISGVEQFNRHSGYADSFVWGGDFQDQTPRDVWGRRCTRIVAMDALHYRDPKYQYGVPVMQRELNKAFCGFFEYNVAPENLPAVATGNWGCGAFKGNPHLKFIIQLMAASEAGRDISYFTFSNCKLEKELKHLYDLISSHDVQIGDIWTLLCEYSSVVLSSQKTGLSTFYDFFCKIFCSGSVGDKSSEDSSSISSEKTSENSSSSSVSSEATQCYESSDGSTHVVPPSPNEEFG